MSAWLLAVSPSQPDREFSSTAKLAAWILAERCQQPGQPEIKLVTAVLARDALPGGACVSVYVLDGSQRNGRLLGFALCMSQPAPATHRDHAFVVSPARVLMDAIDVARDAASPRAAA